MDGRSGESTAEGRRGLKAVLEKWTNIPHSCLTPSRYLAIQLTLAALALFVQVTCWHARPLYDRNLRQTVTTPLSCLENGEQRGEESFSVDAL